MCLHMHRNHAGEYSYAALESRWCVRVCFSSSLACVHIHVICAPLRTHIIHPRFCVCVYFSFVIVHLHIVVICACVYACTFESRMCACACAFACACLLVSVHGRHEYRSLVHVSHHVLSSS